MTIDDNPDELERRILRQNAAAMCERHAAEAELPSTVPFEEKAIEALTDDECMLVLAIHLADKKDEVPARTSVDPTRHFISEKAFDSWVQKSATLYAGHLSDIQVDTKDENENKTPLSRAEERLDAQVKAEAEFQPISAEGSNAWNEWQNQPRFDCSTVRKRGREKLASMVRPKEQASARSTDYPPIQMKVEDESKFKWKLTGRGRSLAESFLDNREIPIEQSMDRKPRKLVNYLLTCKDSQSSFSDCAKPVFGDPEEFVTEGQLGGLRKRANKFFSDHGIPLRVAITDGNVLLATVKKTA